MARSVEVGAASGRKCLFSPVILFLQILDSLKKKKEQWFQFEPFWTIWFVFVQSTLGHVNITLLSKPRLRSGLCILLLLCQPDPIIMAL